MLSIFETVFLIILCIYFVQTVLFIIGASKKYNKVSDEELPSISIVVAARNEESNIEACIKSLDELSYPEGKIEIVIVDDNSTDRTSEIITEFISGKSKFSLYKTSEQIGSLNGKANAIAHAIRESTGEIILTTDADCTVSPTWAKTIASYYQKDVGLVCGYTTQTEFSAFSGMQAVDFIYLLGVAAGTMNFDKPLSCIGNNMSYRRTVYDEIGGYESLPFSVTEDSKLMLTIHDLKKYRVIYPLDAGALVVSKPCSNFKTLYRQKKRWGVGGIDSAMHGFLVMGIGMLSHIAILLTPFFFSNVALYLVLFKLLIDYFFLQPLYKRLNLKLRMKSFIAFEIYFIVYVILLPIILIFNRNVIWKGRKFS